MSVCSPVTALARSPVKTEGFKEILELTGDDVADQKPLHTLEMTIQAQMFRHNEWDKEFEVIEKKEGAILSTQWKCIRDQMSVLARDFATVKHELECLKRNSNQALMKVNQNFHICEAELNGEKQLRLTADEHVEAQLKQIRQDQESEAKQRDAEVSRVLKMMASKFEQFAGSLDARHKAQLSIEHNLGTLRSAVDLLQPQLDALQKNISEDAYERKNKETRLIDTFAAHREKLVKELQDHAVKHKASLQSLKNTVEQERTDRTLAFSSLRSEFNKIHERNLPSKEELPAFCGKCNGLEDMLVTQLKEQQQAIKRVTMEQTAGQLRLEQNITQISARIETEKNSRTTFMEDVESMLKASRSKVRSLMDEQAEIAKQARDALGMTFLKQLEKETKSRNAQQEDMREYISDQKTALDRRIDTLHQNLTGFNDHLRIEKQRGWNGEARWEKKANELSKQIHDLRDTISGCLSEERAIREATVIQLEEQISFLDSLFNDVGKRFMESRQRRKHIIPPRLSLGSSTVSSQIGIPIFTPQTSSTDDTVLASSTSVPASPQSATPRVSSEADTASIDNKIINTELPASALKKLKEVRFEAPDLPSHKTDLLVQVLQQGRIELSFNPDAASAQVKLQEPLQFTPVHHGDTPVMHFLHESKTMDMLGDVAELLMIYHTASLLIEAHMAAPPKELDKWARDLADGRAEMVKAMIASFGVMPGRIKTIGLPGKLGNDKQEIVLKITSFSATTG